MANRLTKYKETMNVRISEFAKAWAAERVPSFHPSFAAYVDHLIRRDKKMELDRIKKLRKRGVYRDEATSEESVEGA